MEWTIYGLLKNLLPLQIIKRWNYDSSVNSQLFLPRYCDSLRQDWQRKMCLQGSGTDIFSLCLALPSSFSETLIKCVSARCVSHLFHLSCFIDPLLGGLSIYQQLLKNQALKYSSTTVLQLLSCFSYWTNAEPGWVQLSPEACPAKYVWQSCLGISSWSAHRSDGSDFKYPLKFLQGEWNVYAECHLNRSSETT